MSGRTGAAADADPTCGPIRIATCDWRIRFGIVSDPVTTRPAICLNMIVHNDARMRDDGHIIQETLDSVAPYITSWVIVDTGSDDGTQGLVRDHMARLGIPGELYERPLRAIGQNYTEAIDLAQGRGDFIWVMNAGDILVGTPDLDALTADAYALRYRTDDVTGWRTQLFRSGLRWRYEGVLLESPSCDDPYVPGRVEGRYQIEHHRLGDRSHELHKRAPDQELLLAELARNPEDVESIILLAESCFEQHDFVGARKWYARRLDVEGVSSTEESYFVLYRLAVSMHQLGEPWPDVQNAYLRAWDFRPTRAEPLYAIACRYRHEKQYDLGYQFAQRANAIPLPEADRLIPQPDIYTWRAGDEQAVCASWIGKQCEAFTLCRALLARSDIHDHDRVRIAANRDFSVPAMIKATSFYPDVLIRNLIGRQRDAEVTVSLIVGPDRESAEQTLDSFLNCCTDVSQVGRFLAVDAGLSLQDREILSARYTFCEFVDAGSGDGPDARLGQIRSHVGGRFWLHLGQHWRFFAPEDLITRLRAVLEAEPLVLQVGVNFADAFDLNGACAVDQVVRRTPEAGRYVLTEEVSGGPAMFDTARLDLVGGVDRAALNPIAELRRRAAAAGLRAASLDEVLCVGLDSRTLKTQVEVISSPAESAPKIHRFCVTHTEPLIPRSWYDDCIALGEYQPDSVSHVSQLDRYWHEARPLAYGAAGSYALPAAIRRLANDADLIEIAMYRKKILLSPEGKPGAHPRSRELSVEECRQKTEFSSPITPPSDSGFLVAQPLYVEHGLMGLYGGYHPFRDLLDYTSLAMEIGILDHQSAQEFFTGKIVIPGGTEFGIFPKSWLLSTLPKLEQVSREFLGRYGERVKQYDAFQVRAVGFLSECLGSFLVVRHLQDRYSNNIPANVFGYMTCVVEEGLGYHAGVAG